MPPRPTAVRRIQYEEESRQSYNNPVSGPDTFAGLSLLLYPTVSNYWNSLHQSRAIAAYVEQVAQIDNETFDQLREQARAYNRTLVGKAYRYDMTRQEREEYLGLLNVSGNGIIGYIEIPDIHCELPIYHGTDADALQIGVGHIEGSSLPVGGESTHCAISGHRGLPSAKLFSDLDKLTVGDRFSLRVLDDTLTYEVDQIHTVLPGEMDELEIVEGEDYCTLVTCTPYGINTHRLLVRGHRVENSTDNAPASVITDAPQTEPLGATPMPLPILLVPPLVLLALLLVFLLSKRKNDRFAPNCQSI